MRNTNSHQDRNAFISNENVQEAFNHAEVVRLHLIIRKVLQRNILTPRTFQEFVSLFHMLKGKMIDIMCRQLGLCRGRYETAKITLTQMKQQWEQELALIKKKL
jgi:hypothetical protein